MPWWIYEILAPSLASCICWRWAFRDIYSENRIKGRSVGSPDHLEPYESKQAAFANAFLWATLLFWAVPFVLLFEHKPKIDPDIIAKRLAGEAPELTKKRNEERAEQLKTLEKEAGLP